MENINNKTNSPIHNAADAMHHLGHFHTSYRYLRLPKISKCSILSLFFILILSFSGCYISKDFYRDTRDGYSINNSYFTKENQTPLSKKIEIELKYRKLEIEKDSTMFFADIELRNICNKIVCMRLGFNGINYSSENGEITLCVLHNGLIYIDAATFDKGGPPEKTIILPKKSRHFYKEFDFKNYLYAYDSINRTNYYHLPDNLSFGKYYLRAVYINESDTIYSNIIEIEYQN